MRAITSARGRSACRRCSAADILATPPDGIAGCGFWRETIGGGGYQATVDPSWVFERVLIPATLPVK